MDKLQEEPVLTSGLIETARCARVSSARALLQKDRTDDSRNRRKMAYASARYHNSTCFLGGGYASNPVCSIASLDGAGLRSTNASYVYNALFIGLICYPWGTICDLVE